MQNIFTLVKMTPFIKLASDFAVNWNVDDIISKISDDVIDQNNNLGPYFDPSGIAHWQYYLLVNISFTRNFFRNFPRECLEVSEKLKKLQASYADVPTNDELMMTFINHKIVPQRVNIIRTVGGGDVNPHSDVTRDVCINIGLQNSDIFKTRMSDNVNAEYFNNTPTKDFTMNDGDVYLLSTKNAHSVETTIDSNTPRYIITYNLK
jgi:hypothetical protein